ncbi:hypothetical protein GCM10007425_08740 [Lysinibacillus alkalisoli]|uniref:Bile acid:sodium symporter family protein n=1 Tax=Lysinibacillus alkalisoli TaxID=1911548 RepID=A0A917LEQ8_9BACI|nr:bile acid:sodium symporter family protein [Lysinibacillus alkalisoli]GGG16656.1 hypothetical protein GCM10007425_08740 [Lysinibacillus alkalisoli]
MIQTLNAFLQKYIAILTPLSLVIGVILHNVGEKILFIVPFLFAFMTFTGSLSMRVKDSNVFRRFPLTILCSIAFLHVLMPVWAYFLATIIFDDTLLTIGFVVAVAVPTGITSMIWITVCKGNMPLALAIILIDTLLAPFIMPTLLYVMVGAVIEVDASRLLVDLLWMIVLPTIVGIILNALSHGTIQKKWSPRLAPFSKLALFGVVMINGSAVSPYLKNFNWHVVAIIVTVLIVSISGYTFALLIGKTVYYKQPDVAISFMFLGGMRNIAVGVVIATSYFPAKVAMPVVFGMLFQQVLASTFSKLTPRMRPTLTT